MLVCRHFDRWVESIKDESVKKLVQQNTVMTGGALASLLDTNKVNDFDFYFRTRETALAVARYYVAQFNANPPTRFRGEGGNVKVWVEDCADGRVKVIVKSAGVAGENNQEDYAYFEGDPNPEAMEKFLEAAKAAAEDSAPVDPKTDENRPPFRPVWITANAITLSDKTQVILRFIGDPEEIHKNYDFVHCTLAWTSWERRVRLNAEALESILTKDLRYVGSLYPVCSLFRVRKFVERGWKITAGQILKIVFQVNKLDLDDYAVLEDQLTGVDVAYFAQLLDKLKERDPNKVDEAYLAELLDKMV